MGIFIERQQHVCIWTEAGVLNDKLCDRDFQCEHCPLDAALRDHSDNCREEGPELAFTEISIPANGALPEHVKTLLAPFLTLKVCTDLRYSSRHAWVRILPSGMVRCGLDTFAAALLPSESQIVVIANNTFVREGEEFAWVYGGSRTLPLSAPVSGTIICRNTELLTNAESIRLSPYEDGCIVTLAPSVGALATARLSSPRNHIRRIRKRARILTERVHRMLGTDDVGVCLNDGGAPVTSLDALLGEERYWSLLHRFVGGD